MLGSIAGLYIAGIGWIWPEAMGERRRFAGFSDPVIV
jgi:hypothetical protein